jgi:hypothetical protein
MILWAIHPVEFWERLRNRKILRADGRHSDNFFRPAYRWMSEQMKLRLPCSPSRRTYPLWAWYQYDGGTEKEARSPLAGASDEMHTRGENRV